MLWAVACLDGMLPPILGSAPVQRSSSSVCSSDRSSGREMNLFTRVYQRSSHYAASLKKEKKVLPPTGFEPARS